MSDTILHHETLREAAQSVSCVELANMLGVSALRIRQLTKMHDDSLRPPGYKVGREYRIWVSKLPDYLHSEGKYADGGFAEAMEVLNV